MHFLSVSLLRLMIEPGFPANNTEDPGFGPCKYSIQRVWISGDRLGRLIWSRVALGRRSGCDSCLHCIAANTVLVDTVAVWAEIALYYSQLLEVILNH